MKLSFHTLYYIVIVNHKLCFIFIYKYLDNMLEYKIINSKPTIVNNNVEYMDLLASTFNTKISLSGTPLIVNKYYVARPDLISQAMYGTDKYADIICKVNGISNPFELNEDDMILVPSIEYCENSINTNITACELITTNSTNVNSQTKNYQKTTSETRSPNEQLSGEQNYIIDQSSGLIFY